MHTEVEGYEKNYTKKMEDFMISNMRLERTKREITQIDLWMKTGIPQWRISLIERGIQPKLNEKKKIAKVLGCKVADIFSENEGLKNDCSRNT